MTFGTPQDPGAGGDSFAYKEHLGELVVIEVLGVRPQVQTKAGVADAISANVTVIAGAEPGRIYTDALLFGSVAFNQIKGNVGQRVLVRVAQGQAQPGKSAPWVLDTNVTAEEQQHALAVLASSSMGQPATAGAPAQGYQPAPAQYPAPPPAAAPQYAVPPAPAPAPPQSF